MAIDPKPTQLDMFGSPKLPAKLNGHHKPPAKRKTNGNGNGHATCGIATLREMLAIWNEEMGDLSTARALGEHRAKHMRTRLLNTFAGEIEQWREYVRTIRATPFCCGESERGWVCDLDAACQERTCTRIIEGYYRRQQRQANGLAATLRALRQA